MRTPKALDAAVRWLALTGAAAVVSLIVPSSSLGGGTWLRLGGPAGVHVVHVVVLAVVLLAWMQCSVHFLRLCPLWHRDPWIIGLGSASLVTFAMSIAAALLGSAVAITWAVAILASLELPLALRIDHRADNQARTPAASVGVVGPAGG